MEDAPAGTVASEGITAEELRLAARNHGLPLEALRHEITPPGLHYLLIHYDIPAVDPAAFRLEVGGAVEQPLTLSLDDLRARERVAEPITFECAGNGRALLEPRPISQPWLTEAVGTAEWGGTLLAPLLDEAGRSPARSRSSSPRSTEASRAACRRPTSARCRSRRPTPRCSPTR